MESDNNIPDNTGSGEVGFSYEKMVSSSDSKQAENQMEVEKETIKVAKKEAVADAGAEELHGRKMLEMIRDTMIGEDRVLIIVLLAQNEPVEEEPRRSLRLKHQEDMIVARGGQMGRSYYITNSLSPTVCPHLIVRCAGEVHQRYGRDTSRAGGIGWWQEAVANCISIRL